MCHYKPFLQNIVSMRATGRHKMHFPKKTTHFPNVLNNRYGDLTKPYAIFQFFSKNMRPHLALTAKTSLKTLNLS